MLGRFPRPLLLVTARCSYPGTVALVSFVVFDKQVFFLILTKSKLSIFVMTNVFYASSHKPLPTQDDKDIFLCFLIDDLWLKILYIGLALFEFI